MSVEKCSASASSACELCFLAARASMRERVTSTTMEVPMTMNDQIEIVTCALGLVNRWTAS